MGGSSIHLQRYCRTKTRLNSSSSKTIANNGPKTSDNSSDLTHIYDFVVEHPLSIGSIEVRSLPFKFNGHSWYLYMSRSGDDYLSCHLRAVNLAPDLSVKINYAFTVIHPSQNEQTHFSVSGPDKGRVFSRANNTER